MPSLPGSRTATAILTVAVLSGCSLNLSSQADEFNAWLSAGGTPYVAAITSAQNQVATAWESGEPAAFTSACQQFAGAISAATTYALTNPPPNDIIPTWHDAMTHESNAVTACLAGNYDMLLSEAKVGANDLLKLTGEKPLS